MIHSDEISKTVRAYLDRHPDEAGRLTALNVALTQPDDLTSRKTLPGHVTCSAVILDPQGRVLHIRHNQLGTWLRPGGHLEPDDTSLVDAALREVAEETGIRASELSLVDDAPIDIDVHDIPARPAKGEPDHQHFDLRFMFTTVGGALTVELQADEVNDFAWLPTTKLRPRSLLERVAVLGAGE